MANNPSIPCALLASLLAACASPAQMEHAPAEVRETLAGLATAFNTCSVDKALAFYDKDVYFVSSNTSRPITSVEGVRRYLEGGCRMAPGSTVTINSQEVRFVGDYAISTGRYTFTVVQGSKSSEQPNNYTLTLRREAGGWKIISHHSSLVPSGTGR